MIDALIKEVTLFTKTSSDKASHPLQQKESLVSSPEDTSNIETIYFGGGTPSLLSGTEIKKIMDVVLANFSVKKDAEVTLEANPGTVEQQRFKDYRSLGINRLSIGVQSFNADFLKKLGRIHDDKQAHKAIHAARLG